MFAHSSWESSVPAHGHGERSWAVLSLQDAILFYIPQIVQALRYDKVRFAGTAVLTGLLRGSLPLTGSP